MYYLDMRDKDSFEIHFRPGSDPAFAVPFGVRSAGRYSVAPPWREDFPGRSFGEVFYGLEGAGLFQLEGENYVLEPRCALVVPPGVAQYLRPKSKRWQYAWFTIDGPRSTEVFRWFGLGQGLYGPVDFDQSFWSRLMELVADATLRGQSRSSAQVFGFLAELCPVSPVGDAHSALVDHALALLRVRYGRPEFDITRLAMELAVHRSVLTRRFRSELGRNPSAVLKELRIRVAIGLLQETLLSVEEVALRSGFDDPNYFSRVVKKWTGRTPTQLRHDSGGAR